jgi:hypothetical protein
MVDEIKQEQDVEENKAVDSVSEEDTGEIGNLGGDGDDDDSGMPGWLWIVIAIVAMAIIAGVIFMVVRNKEDQDFDAKQEDINMSHVDTPHHH